MTPTMSAQVDRRQLEAIAGMIRNPKIRGHFRFLARKIPEAGALRLQDLCDRYEALTRGEKFVVLCLLRRRRIPGGHDLLLRVVMSADPFLSGAAAAALASTGGMRVARKIQSFALAASNERQIATLLSVFTWIRLKQPEPFVEFLVAWYEDRRRPESTRAQALMGLGGLSSLLDKRRRLYHEGLK